jgi:hypothetical protein
MTNTAIPPDDDRASRESFEDEGKQSEEHSSEERREAPERDERTVTESGGWGAPERGED